MKHSKDFIIPFEHLKLGAHHFDFQIDDTFFEDFAFQEFSKTFIKARLEFIKNQTSLILRFKSEGVVQIPCDLTGEPFDLPIKGNMKILVRFAAHSCQEDEVVVIPYSQRTLNVKQYIYEMIVLSVPLKRVNPRSKGWEDRMRVFKDEKQNKESDPRWDQLKKIVIN